MMIRSSMPEAIYAAHRAGRHYATPTITQRTTAPDRYEITNTKKRHDDTVIDARGYLCRT